MKKIVNQNSDLRAQEVERKGAHHAAVRVVEDRVREVEQHVLRMHPLVARGLVLLQHLRRVDYLGCGLVCSFFI